MIFLGYLAPRGKKYVQIDNTQEWLHKLDKGIYKTTNKNQNQIYKDTMISEDSCK